MPTPSSRNGRIWVVLVALVGAGCGAEQIDGTGAAGGGGVTHSGGNGGTAGVGGVAPDAGGGGGCVRQIGASWEFTCAVRTDDSAWCWGDAGYAFLDDFVQSAHPVRLTSFGTEVVQIAAGWHHACALTKAGAVSCWGSNDAGQLGSDGVSTTAIGSDVVSVASRHNHTCVVRVDGSVWCWGSNYSGQIGDGTTVDQPLPKRVNSVGAGVTQVTVGDGHSCAATSDGTVWCWGFNHNGQLGDGTTEAKTTPTPVFKLATPPRELTSGFDFTCALEQNGSLWCWGAGQLEPSKVEGIGAKVAQIGSGRLHICAVTEAGALWCWGKNFSGQLGTGTTDDQVAPVLILGSGVVRVAGGRHHTCAIVADGSPLCWGQNSASQLGDGTTLGMQTSPVPVVGLCP